MRNVKKNVEEGKKIIRKRHNLDMNVSELSVFFDEFADTAKKTDIYTALWDAVVGAYKMGLAVGMRNH